MTSSDVIAMFKASGALLEGHFRLTSGLHSSGYLQCALVLQHPKQAQALGAALASRARALVPTVVLSPALGGIVIGHEVASALGVRALFVERQDGVMQLRRGFSLSPTDRVFVVEDVVTTGGSTKETMSVAGALGALVIGAGSIINRGAEALGVPYLALADVTIPTFEPEACPLCRQGLAVTKPGSRSV